MVLAEVIQADQVVAAVGSLVGGLWAMFKTGDWFARVKKQRYYTAVEAVEAAVDATYRTYVQQLKQAREDGKLTAQEREQARSMARQTAVEYGRTAGVDVLKELGD